MNGEMRIDKEYLQDVTPVILYLEERGITDPEKIKEWFEINLPHLKVHAELYLEYKNAGRQNPLQVPLDQVDTQEMLGD